MKNIPVGHGFSGFNLSGLDAILSNSLPSIVLVLLSFASASMLTATETAKPNVLFVAVDDMKDWVGCLGGYAGTVHTPHIDRLAKRGMLFTNAHCASPKCAPSRAAIMTGLRPSTTGLYDNGHWWLPNLPDVITMPAHFRTHGYHVVGAGKIFHHTAGNNPPNQWDDFLPLRFRDDPWFRGSKLNYPWSQHGPLPPGYPFSGVQGLGHENDWGSLPIPDEEYDDALSVNYAVDYLCKKHERPFFLACGLFRPHLPWYVPARFFDLYPLDQIRLPRVRDDDLSDVPAAGQKLATARKQDFELIRSADRWKHAVRAYLASISYADEQVGRVLDALDASDHQANTIIVFWSDHGWHLGEKGHWHKSTLWEEATRVPLIISAPEIDPGTCGAPVSLLDLYPTLVEICRIGFQSATQQSSSSRGDTALTKESMPKLDGVSLMSLLHNPDSDWNRPAVTEFRRGNAAVRSARYRYIRYRDGSEELYDHTTDPHEWTNLVDRPERVEIKTELGQWITRKWAESAATKNAFQFDPDTYKWTNKSTGKMISGYE